MWFSQYADKRKDEDRMLIRASSTEDGSLIPTPPWHTLPSWVLW